MKTILMMVSTALISACSFAGNPPAAVQKAFQEKFPKATNVKWGKENATEYEAEFEIGLAKMSANFTTDGTWVETETEILASQLPSIVSAAIKKQYPGYEIAEAEKVENAKKETLYEIEIKSGAKKKEVTFKEDGTPVTE